MKTNSKGLTGNNNKIEKEPVVRSFCVDGKLEIEVGMSDIAAHKFRNLRLKDFNSWKSKISVSF